MKCRLLVLLLCLVACYQQEQVYKTLPSNIDPTRIVETDIGLTLHNCALDFNDLSEEDGYIRNRNPYSVLIRQVWRGPYGESTIRFLSVAANGGLTLIHNINISYGFYVYVNTQEQTYLGYFSGSCQQ